MAQTQPQPLDTFTVDKIENDEQPSIVVEVSSRDEFARAFGHLVSEEGFFLPLDPPLPPIGSSFHLRVRTKAETLVEAGGEVCWTSDEQGGPLGTESGVALCFRTPPSVGAELVRSLRAHRDKRLLTGDLPEARAVPLIFQTFGDARARMADVASRPLRPWLDQFAHGYAEVGKRNGFLWRWCVDGAKATSLPCVAPGLLDSVVDLKVLGMMFDVLVDDIADERQDGPMLDAALRLGTPGARLDLAPFDDEARRYLEFTARVWEAIHTRARSYPRYAEFKDLFEYDYHQLLNTMHFAYLVNRNPRMLNLWEHDLYQPHNMHIMINCTADMMCSPDFDAEELGIVRSAAATAQRMGRIGNMITTWERELKVGDFSSGVWFYAIEQQILSPDELRADNAEAVRKRLVDAAVERHFLLEWESLRERLRAMRPRIHSFDLASYLAGFEQLFQNHINSRGLK